MRILATLLVLLSPVAVQAAYADSDGYYCVGHDYLAYQFGKAAPPVAPHHVYVLRLTGASRIEDPAIIQLPQFQVQGMVCGDRSIRIAAFDAIYTVRLDVRSRPLGFTSAPLPFDRRMPPEFVGQAKNLAGITRAARDLTTERVTIGRSADGGRFILEIRSVRSERCAASIRTRILRLDRNGRVIEEAQVFDGRAALECGGGSPDSRMEPSRPLPQFSGRPRAHVRTGPI